MIYASVSYYTEKKMEIPQIISLEMLPARLTI